MANGLTKPIAQAQAALKQETRSRASQMQLYGC